MAKEGFFMFELLKSTSLVLGSLKTKWCFCGGWAIDLYLAKETRPHKDLDIMIFKKDLQETIDYMKTNGWKVEAPTRQGFLPVDSDNYEEFEYDNLWCMNEQYPLDYLKVDEQSAYNFYHYEREEQKDLDFLEILLNSSENGYFVYQRNPEIRLEVNKALYSFEGIPYLAPEIVLLYKSKYLSEDNQADFELVIPKMKDSQKSWLVEALKYEYGSDHPWVMILS